MKSQIIISGKVVNPNSISMADVDMADYPDFCDAYAEEAEFMDGTPLTEAELELLSVEYGNELAHESMF